MRGLSRPAAAALVGCVAAVFALVPVALFARAMMAGLNHDEQQFIAAGWLHAHLQLLPYRDFPYFHMPLFVLADGWIFAHCSRLLLAARAASVFWAWLGLVAVFGIGLALFRSQPPARRLVLALAPAALLFVNPVFTYTYFRAWNHSLPTLLTILAIGCQCRGAAAGTCRWFVASGVFLALAIGTRLSFAPLGLPFLLMAWRSPGRGHRAAVAFCGGLFLGFLPSAAVIVRAPAAFLFDNFVYNGAINAAYRGEGARFRAAAEAKMLFLLGTLLKPANLWLAAAFVFLHWRGAGRERTYFSRLVLAVLPFAWLGAISATPCFLQYYYPVVTLAALGILAGLAESQWDIRKFRIGVRLTAGALAVGTVTALIDYRGIFEFADLRRWVPIQAHAVGDAMRSVSSAGPVLTLAPLFPLEAGLKIYPAFATGPFAWRTARFLTAAQRARYGFVGEEELGSLLAAQPPASILTGVEKKKLEDPLVAYAGQHHYREIKLPGGLSLWVAPRTGMDELVNEPKARPTLPSREGSGPSPRFPAIDRNGRREE